MAMAQATKKRISQYIFLPLFLLMALYFFIGSAINVHWGQAYLYPDTMLKYTLSIIFDKLDISILFFGIPDEYRGYFQTVSGMGNALMQLPICNFHLLMEKLPMKMTYIMFPYWLVISLTASLIIFGAKTAAISAEESAKSNDKTVRGARKLSSYMYCAKSAHTTNPGLSLPCVDGNLVISQFAEKQHFAILGASGTGKSSLLLSMIARWRQRGTKLILIDRKGEFYAKFGDPSKDIIFNPYYIRSVNWSLFNEFGLDRKQKFEKISPQLKATVYTLFGITPSMSAKEGFWRKNAAAVFISALCYLTLHGKTSNQDAQDFFAQPLTSVLACFKTLPLPMQIGVAALGDNGGTEQAAGTLSTLADRTSELGCCQDGDFSIRRWMTESDPDASLFISMAGEYGDSFSSLVSLFLDLISCAVKNAKDDGGQKTRFVFVVDELASLPQLFTLVMLLSQGRSKGISTILANQTYTEIEKIYGETAKHIIGNAQNRFLFRMSEPTNAKYFSDLTGSAEVQRETISKNLSSGSMLSIGQVREGENTTKQLTIDPVFLPSDYAGLQIGEAVAQIADIGGVSSRVKFKYEKFPSVNAEYEPLETDYVVAKDVVSAIRASAAVPEPKTDEPIDQQALGKEQTKEQTKEQEQKQKGLLHW